MSSDNDHAAGTAPAPQTPEQPDETLTDFMDRMDREAFHRALEQRDLRVLAMAVRAQR